MAIGDQRDPEATRAALTPWFASRLPDARDVEVRNLVVPTMGFSNETLLLDLAWRDPDGAHVEPLVIRVRPKGQIFPEYDLGRQYDVMRRLAATDVPVPRMRWFEESDAVLGASFYVMDRIEGVVPPDNPPYHVAGVCTEMSPESREALWWDGLDKLARVHKLDWRALGFDYLDSRQWGRTPLEQQLNYYEHFLRWAWGERPHPTCTPALAWLREHMPANEPVGLCWGDSRIGNQMFRDDRCVAVLDWEMVWLGNPEQDLAWWLFLDWHHSAGIGVDRLAGFPSREATIARYEELVGRRVEHLHYYEVFAAFRFAVIMIRVVALVRAAELPMPENYEVNNTCTQGLAGLLGLPPPH
ncbi:MAG TPA: phosphotransferase family protein [Candidatus Binatia bacterium]|nr:phosphotransferase family protein [Candidatus Binatia bacterium]